MKNEVKGIIIEINIDDIIEIDLLNLLKSKITIEEKNNWITNRPMHIEIVFRNESMNEISFTNAENIVKNDTKLIIWYKNIKRSSTDSLVINILFLEILLITRKASASSTISFLNIVDEITIENITKIIKGSIIIKILELSLKVFSLLIIIGTNSENNITGVIKRIIMLSLFFMIFLNKNNE